MFIQYMEIFTFLLSIMVYGFFVFNRILLPLIFFLNNYFFNFLFNFYEYHLIFIFSVYLFLFFVFFFLAFLIVIQGLVSDGTLTRISWLHLQSLKHWATMYFPQECLNCLICFSLKLLEKSVCCHPLEDFETQSMIKT